MATNPTLTLLKNSHASNHASNMEGFYMNGPRLAPARGNDPWIVAQVLRIRALETEVKDLFAVGGTPKKFIQRRVAELDSQVTLLDMALS